MVTYLGSLVQSCCGEGGKLQTNITGVCGKYSQCLGHTVCAFQSTLLRLQVALQGDCLKRTLGCVHFPGTRAAQPTRCLVSALSSSAVHLIASPIPGFLDAQQERYLRCAVCLLWGAALRLRPSWWMSTVQDPRKTYLATGSLFAIW